MTEQQATRASSHLQRRPRRRGPKQSTKQNSRDKAPRVCPYFLKGNCRHGAGCSMLHEGVVVAASSSVSDCPICFESIPSSRLTSLSACGSHSYCRGCLRSHFATLISANELDRISCPHPECKAVPTEGDLRSLLTRRQQQSYERFTVLSAFKGQKTLWCPFPKCGELCLADEGCSTRAACPSCQGVFCLSCSLPDHPGKDCQSSFLDHKFAEWTEKQGHRVKLCPSCLQQVAKTEGCNHMTCICGHGFCWLCARDTGPDHFSAGFCRGLQFSNSNTVAEARLAEVASAYKDQLNRAKSTIENERRDVHRKLQKEKWREMSDSLRKIHSVRVWNPEKRRYFWEIENREAFEVIKKQVSAGLHQEFKQLWDSERGERERLLEVAKETLEAAHVEELARVHAQLAEFDQHQAAFQSERAARVAAQREQRELAEKARREAEERARLEAEERARLEAEERARHEAEQRARHEAEQRARHEQRHQLQTLARSEEEAARRDVKTTVRRRRRPNTRKPRLVAAAS